MDRCVPCTLSWNFRENPCSRMIAATMLRLASEREAVQVVTDQVGCPTWTGHLAPALVALVAQRRLGVLHIAASGACSWCEFAVAIVAGDWANSEKPAIRARFQIRSVTSIVVLRPAE